MNTKIIDPRKLYDLTDRILSDVKSFIGDYNYECVVGIQNGGIPLASYLATALSLELIPVKISFYGDDKKPSKNPLCVFPEKITRLKDSDVPFLLVDDVIDSGSTILYFEEKTGFINNRDFDVACYFWDKLNKSKIIPRFFQELKSQEDWIVFPWEHQYQFCDYWQVHLDLLRKKYQNNSQ